MSSSLLHRNSWDSMTSLILGMDRAPILSSCNVTVKPLSSAGPTEGSILGIPPVSSVGGKWSSVPCTAVLPLVLDGSPLFDSYLWHVVDSYEHTSANKFWKFGQTFPNSNTLNVNLIDSDLVPILGLQLLLKLSF